MRVRVTNEFREILKDTKKRPNYVRKIGLWTKYRTDIVWNSLQRITSRFYGPALMSSDHIRGFCDVVVIVVTNVRGCAGQVVPRDARSVDVISANFAFETLLSAYEDGCDPCRGSLHDLATHLQHPSPTRHPAMTSPKHQVLKACKETAFKYLAFKAHRCSI